MRPAFPSSALYPIAETLLIAAAGGVAFVLIGFPAGLVTGSMLAVTVAALLGRPMKIPLLLARVCYVVTGTLFSGALQAGDEVDVVGAGATARSVRVRGVQVHGHGVPRAQAGQRTAANLAAIEVAQAPRGSALVAAGTLEATVV